MRNFYRAKFAYDKKIGSVLISKEIEDENILKIFIETPRFTAESIYSEAKEFDQLQDNLKQLYKVTYGDSLVMEKYSTGIPKTQEKFFNIVQKQSLRWSVHYPFGAFIVTDHGSDKDNNVVGYEVIENSIESNNTGEISYLFNKDYHRSDKIQNVGYECAGALVFNYAKKLYDENFFVNRIYNETFNRFEGGQVFKKLYAETLFDNQASCALLEKLGFKHQKDKNGIVKISFKNNNFKYDFELSFDAPDVMFGETLGSIE